jgi:hypothetical protein
LPLRCHRWREFEIGFRADRQAHGGSDIKIAEACLYLGKALRQLTDHLRGQDGAFGN